MSNNTSFDKKVNELKDKFKNFSTSNRNTYYNFMDFIDNIEELANTVADNLNSIADDIDDITYDIMFGENSNSNSVYGNKENNESKNREDKNDENKKETIKINIEKFKIKINSSANECRLKIEEVKNLIKDFDYASRKSYEDSCLDLQRSLEEDFNTMKGTKSINDFVDRFNNVIDYINNLYRSAYYKKNNKSSLAFIMDNDEDIDFIETINVNEFVEN